MVAMIIKEFDSRAEKNNVGKLYENITPTETLMCELLMKYPYLIEEGLVYLDHHVRTGEQVRLDFLFADSNGVLVIAELNVEESEDILLGCLEYYDEIVTNAGSYAKIFGDKYGININPAIKPRMMLIASGFGAKFIEKCRWLSMNVSAFTFKCIKPRYSEFVLPVFNSVHIPLVPRGMESGNGQVIRESVDDVDNEETEECNDTIEKKAVVKDRDYKIYFGDQQEEAVQKIEFEESIEKLETDYEPQGSD